jgi:hypothetical protein
MELPSEPHNNIQENSKPGDEAILKLYIGQGLRQDLAKQFGDPLIENNV